MSAIDDKVNFGGLPESETQQFELIPAGQYGGIIEDVPVETNKAGDKKCLTWTVRLTEGGPGIANRLVWMRSWLTENARGNTWRTASEILGRPLPLEELDWEAYRPMYLGLPVTARIEQEDYNGELKNVVKRLKRARGAPPPPTPIETKGKKASLF